MGLHCKEQYPRKMKRRKTRMTDLNVDVLRHITNSIATSSDGASNLIMLSSVVFKELSEEADILKAVKFHDLNLSSLHGSFWQKNGLLCRCMQNGNLSALHVAMEYANTLDVSYKEHKWALFRGMVILLARIRAVDAVNTRLRQQALNSAEDEYRKICDAADVDIKKGKEFLDMLRTVTK